MRARYQEANYVNYIALSCLLGACHVLILACDVCLKIRIVVNEVVLG
jgi:hypothetical protein